MMFEIRSGRLRIEIANPAEPPNDTCRFDRAGFITEVVLDGRHRFCATEPNNLKHPSTGGRGICNEYKMDVSGEAAPGGYFPKLGIGLFKKEKDEPYSFYNKYECKPYSVSFKREDSRAVFTTEAQDCMGYAVRQEKEISVNDSTLTMKVRLENPGQKDIDAMEYCHNFLTINGMAIGPDYVIETPNLSDRGKGVIEGIFRGCGNGYTFGNYQPEASLLLPDIKDLRMDGCFSWTMRNNAAKAGIEVEDFFRPGHLAIWQADHMVSFEVFHTIKLKPGESGEWVRRWTFFGLPAG
jgi:hypothetical protein